MIRHQVDPRGKIARGGLTEAELVKSADHNAGPGGCHHRARLLEAAREVEPVAVRKEDLHCLSMPVETAASVKAGEQPT